MPTVALNISQGIAEVTLADAARRNALSLEMVDEIVAVFAELEADADVRVVTITGEGDAFCAGADLATLAGGDRARYARLYEGFLRMARCPLPTIALVNGPAVGAGLNVALACDVRLATPEARFVARFIDIGLHPGGGHTWMLQRAVGRERAMAMLLFGEELDGPASVEAGLALRCVDRSQLAGEAFSMSAPARRAPRELVERIKESVGALGTPAAGDLANAVDVEAEAQAWSAQQDFFRGRVAALLERISSAEKP
jgi:enoyl-CoA hydratase